MAKSVVLVIEDEAKIVELIRVYLERYGYKVIAAADGQEGVRLARQQQPDLVLLDLNLPGIDGLDVCKTLRDESPIPIIMVTARDELEDRLVGLEMGADDYITKPFSPREMVARVRAVLRRASRDVGKKEKVSAGNLCIDFVRHEARCGNKMLSLSPTEFGILSVLAQNPGRVYSRLQLLDLVQGEAYEGYERTVDAHVKNLRQKLAAAAPGSVCHIATVRGVGYKFEVDGVE
ncbi:MAG: response regulator transcription factor [Chloroflexi bacterium]|nr:response regulator transcription factor [Chloroflexota bacterium]